MSNRNLQKLEERLASISKQLKDAADYSISISYNNPNVKKKTINLWQDTLSDFLNYLRKRGKETGENLLSEISLIKILK